MTDDFITIDVVDMFDTAPSRDGEEGQIGLINSNNDRFRLAIPYNLIDPFSVSLMTLKADVETHREKLGKASATEVRTLGVEQVGTEIDETTGTVALHIKMDSGSGIAFAMSPEAAREMARVLAETTRKLDSFKPPKPS